MVNTVLYTKSLEKVDGRVSLSLVPLFRVVSWLRQNRRFLVEMVPPIIKADLPSLLVLAHGGLANGEAALQPAAFAALQTYPGVGK
jgi:hypothetical protein